MPENALESMRRKYFVRDIDIEPKVYWRLTDNWLELTVRFLPMSTACAMSRTR